MDKIKEIDRLIKELDNKLKNKGYYDEELAIKLEELEFETGYVPNNGKSYRKKKR